MTQVEIDVLEAEIEEQEFIEQLDEDYRPTFNPSSIPFRGYPTLSHYDGDIVEDFD